MRVWSNGYVVRSTSDLLIVDSNPGLAKFFPFFHQNETKGESWPVPIFGECTARVKLELTDFKKNSNQKSSVESKIKSSN